jgi:hypothetical protein
MAYLRTFVTDSNDADLNEFGVPTAVPLVGGASETRGCVGTQPWDISWLYRRATSVLGSGLE